jgi:hypothetical protein
MIEMTENNSYNTNVTISANTDNCAIAKLGAISSGKFNTNLSSQLTSQLRTDADQKEVLVRITSKNKMLNCNNIDTF